MKKSGCGDKPISVTPRRHPVTKMTDYSQEGWPLADLAPQEDVALAFEALKDAAAKARGYSSENPLGFLLGGINLQSFWRLSLPEQMKRMESATSLLLVGGSIEQAREILANGAPK